MRYGRRVRNTIGFVAAIATLLGPLAAHWQLVPPLAGFALFALGGIVAALVGVASVVQLVRGRRLTLGGALGVLVGAVFVGIATRSGGHPRINDFTTDLADPPAFRHAATLAPNTGRDLVYPPAFAAVQRECCPELGPAMLPVSRAEAYERALGLARSMPAWTVTSADAAAGTIEAVATSRVFRFQDDIAIRVRPEPGGGSRVDVRSKSRDGKGDIGANAMRIRSFVDALRAGR
jgi:uncharacterized protein (DUF1499 family)